MFNLMALAFISVIEWPRIPTFIPKSALSRLVNSCDDFDVRRAIQFNDSIKIIFSRYYFGYISKMVIMAKMNTRESSCRQFLKKCSKMLLQKIKQVYLRHFLWNTVMEASGRTNRTNRSK